MEDFKSFISVKKNVINLLVLGIIVLSIPIGVNLLQNQTFLFLGATQPPITIEQGPCIKSVDSQGRAIATCTNIPLKLTSPYGGPAPATSTNADANTPKINYSTKNGLTFSSQEVKKSVSDNLIEKVDAASNTCGKSQDIRGVSTDCGQITNVNIANNGESKGEITWQAPNVSSSNTSCTIRVARDRDCNLSGPGTVNSGGQATLRYDPVCDTNTSNSGCRWTINVQGPQQTPAPVPPDPIPTPPPATPTTPPVNPTSPPVTVTPPPGVTVPPLVVSCASDKNQAAVDEIVNWSVQLSGGSTPYTIEWNGSDNFDTRGSGSSAPVTAPFRYSSPGLKTAAVSVMDSTGQVKSTNCNSGVNILSSSTPVTPTGVITANPSSCKVDSQGKCSSTISWTTQNTAGDVVVTVKELSGTVFSGGQSGSEVANFISQPGTTFELYSSPGGTLLSSVRVSGLPADATPPPAAANLTINHATGISGTPVKIDITTSNLPDGTVCTNNWNAFFYNDRSGRGIFPANTSLSDTRIMTQSKNFEITCSVNGQRVAQSAAQFTLIAPPSQPVLSFQSAVSCQDNKISAPLVWQATTGATSYDIYRSDQPKGQNGLIGTTTGTTFIDTEPVATNLIGQQILYGLVAKGPGGSTAAAPISTVVPDCRPIATVSYRLASTQGGLASATVQPYSAFPQAANFQIPENPGTHQIWVQYLSNKGQWSTPESVNVDLLEKPPVISSVDCRLDISQNSVAFNITGERFGQKVGSAGVKANGADVKINDWNQTNISGILANQNLDPKTGQEYKINLTRTDGQTAPIATEGDITCKIGVSQISLGAKLFCRAPSQHDQQNVEITLVGEDGKVTKENVTIDKNGVVQGLTSKLETGRNYVLSLKSPKGLRRNATFKASTGTTVVVGPDGSSFILPIGDIFPVDGGDGRINAQDKAELNRQIRLLTPGQNLSADFNLDRRVNSIDYACMRYDFNKSDDIVPKQAPTGSPIPNSSATPIPSNSPNPSATPSSS